MLLARLSIFFPVLRIRHSVRPFLVCLKLVRYPRFVIGLWSGLRMHPYYPQGVFFLFLVSVSFRISVISVDILSLS